MSEATMSPLDTPPADDRKHAWPTVIGIIGIVLASIGLLSTICVLAIPMDALAKVLPESSQEQFLKQLEQSKTGLSIALTAIGLLLDILLLWGSILLLKRVATCRGLLNAWGVLVIIFVIVGIARMVMLTGSIDQAMVLKENSQLAEVAREQAQETDSQAGEQETERIQRDEDVQQQAQAWGGIVGGVCGGVLGLAWPIIVLCFINGRRNRGIIESWRTSSSPLAH